MLIENNKKQPPVPTREKGFMSTSLLKNRVFQSEECNSGKSLLKIFVPRGTIGIYINSITVRPEEELLLINDMYLRLINFPYCDKRLKKKIFECELIHFYQEFK